MWTRGDFDRTPAAYKVTGSSRVEVSPQAAINVTVSCSELSLLRADEGAGAVNLQALISRDGSIRVADFERSRILATALARP